MSVLHENQDRLDAALAVLENKTKDARAKNREVRDNIAFEDDLSSAQKDRRLTKINPFLGAIQSAVDDAKTVHAATEPIVEE